jgi:hypothetical protein
MANRVERRHTKTPRESDQRGYSAVAQRLHDANNRMAAENDIAAAQILHGNGCAPIRKKHAAVAGEARARAAAEIPHRPFGTGSGHLLGHVRVCFGGCRGRKFDKQIVALVAKRLEEGAAIKLHAGILEVVAALRGMRALERRHKVAPPAFKKRLARHGLRELAF